MAATKGTSGKGKQKSDVPPPPSGGSSPSLWKGLKTLLFGRGGVTHGLVAVLRSLGRACGVVPKAAVASGVLEKVGDGWLVLSIWVSLGVRFGFVRSPSIDSGRRLKREERRALTACPRHAIALTIPRHHTTLYHVHRRLKRAGRRAHRRRRPRRCQKHHLSGVVQRPDQTRPRLMFTSHHVHTRYPNFD